MSKLVEYVGFFHILKERVRESWTQYWAGERRDDDGNGSSVNDDVREANTNFRGSVWEKFQRLKGGTISRINHSTSPTQNQQHQADYSHVYRRKTRSELLRISAAVMGIEFAYAAETAFVSPLLLNLGLRHRHLTLMWFLSPLLGFFITPVLGSLSDGCRSQLGRRRPFIILLSIGVILGLILVPNGKNIGVWIGDTYDKENFSSNLTEYSIQSSWIYKNLTIQSVNWDGDHVNQSKANGLETTHGRFTSGRKNFQTNESGMDTTNGLATDAKAPNSLSTHSWGIIFTVLGTVLLDFDADACQSPSRAYMLDITLPEDHARGLSAFTVMAGMGGSIGYFLGALNWENTFIGDLFGGHVRAVFTLVLFIFIGCVVATLRSFREIPIDRLWTSSHNKDGFYSRFENNKHFGRADSGGTTTTEDEETSFAEGIKSHLPITNCQAESTLAAELPTFREYLKTVVNLPKSLQWLCLTNFFSWISLVCYSLYFTDFVGEAVFEGDPAAPNGSKERIAYEFGVRFGCIGMSLYSLSCALYSLQIQTLVRRFGAKQVYIGGQLSYGLGMICMAIFRHPIGVLVFSWTAGIMYATLFTMPYLLVARYHAAENASFVFSQSKTTEVKEFATQRRGLGTDVAIVSSMVFVAQMTQALTLGSIVALAGTTTAIVCAAAILAFCGALAATKVLYLDL